jgi:hypothetical protein
MANITINNTDKAGHLHIQLGGYFNGTNGDSEFYIPYSFISRVCIGKMDTEDYVELHILDKSAPIFLTNTGGSAAVKIVDTVNGVPPTDFADLKTKILALIP